MLDKNNCYDVIVIGAGSAGSIAALQAGRAGARTLLIEKSSMPGGTLTLCGVDFPGLFHAWGKPVIAGIGWELVSAAVAEGHGTMPDFSRYDLPHWNLQVKVNPALWACLLDEAFTASGVDVLYHAMPLTARELTDGVEITAATKTGAIEYHCHTAIDATGDANLTAMAGYGIRQGVEKQPGTPMVRLGGYDLEHVNLIEVEEAYRKAVATGEMSYLDTGMSRSMAHLLSCNGENCIHVPVADAVSSMDESTVERLGRAAVLRIYRFLRQFRGLEMLKIEYMAPQCGIRETAVINGETTITVDDYVNGRCWDDSLCHAFYQLDLHQSDKASGLMGRPLEFGVVPTIPRRALIPCGSRRLLAAGRCVSSDRLANSALRVQASCMAMGQVAGAVAALAAQHRQPSLEVDIALIKNLLLVNGAIIPPRP